MCEGGWAGLTHSLNNYLRNGMPTMFHGSKTWYNTGIHIHTCGNVTSISRIDLFFHAALFLRLFHGSLVRIHLIIPVIPNVMEFCKFSGPFSRTQSTLKKPMPKATSFWLYRKRTRTIRLNFPLHFLFLRMDQDLGVNHALTAWAGGGGEGLT